MTEVRVIRISELQESEDLLFGSVSERRRQKASRFLQKDDRLRSLAAGYLMEHCIPGWSEARFYTGRDGKPFLLNGVPFSVSHGGDYAAVAWCDGAEGIGKSTFAADAPDPLFIDTEGSTVHMDVRRIETFCFQAFGDRRGAYPGD